MNNPYPPKVKPELCKPQRVTLGDAVARGTGWLLVEVLRTLMWRFPLACLILLAAWAVVAVFEPSAREVSPWEWLTSL